MNICGNGNDSVYLLFEEIIHQTIVFICMVIHYMEESLGNKRKRGYKYSLIERMPNQIRELTRLVGGHHCDCLDNLCVTRSAFGRLCTILRNWGGLVDGKYVFVEEEVSMFLGILAHHKKNRVVKYTFNRSGQTVSHYVHLVLTAMLQLHSVLLVQPVPIPEDSTNHRWKWFKVNGTFINVRVPALDRDRYRTRKGQIATNVLAVCDIDLRFIYVLPGWEGPASDARILRDSINRTHGLKVPLGNYYLCDNANSPGFMALYRGVRYYLNEWGPATTQPANFQEHFNMRHTKARNVGNTMTHQECPGVGRGSMKKACNNTHRIWTTREEKVLINVLKELVNKGYTTDNDFRIGYLIKCEDALKIDFSKTDLQATPHITSKLTSWKKYYSSIVTAHLVTGFGLNTTTSQVECTDEQWDDVIKSVDRKKHKLNSESAGTNNMEHILGEFCSTTGDRLATIPDRIGYEHDLGNARKMLFEQLGVVPGLSIKEKLKASVLIGGKVEYLEIFYSSGRSKSNICQRGIGIER
ncbi:hypothetical protein ACS0TY_003842 [Phlomoides rotata]